jgi:hypothetical protein
MFLDTQTKSFLLKMLNESTQYQPQQYVWNFGSTGDYSPGDAFKINKPPKMNDADWYKKLLDDSAKQADGKIDWAPNKEGPSLGTLAALGALKRSMGYKTNSGETEFLIPGFFDDKGNISLSKMARMAVPTAAKTGLAAAALSTMGPLGSKLSTKLPNIALLGLDPFDYATKIMGVDYVADQLGKLGARQKQQITSGAGYIK